LKNKIEIIVRSSAIVPFGIIANTERKSGANTDSNEKLVEKLKYDVNQFLVKLWVHSKIEACGLSTFGPYFYCIRAYTIHLCGVK